MNFRRVADGLYRRGDHFYYRPHIRGRRTWRAIRHAVTIKAAKDVLAKINGYGVQAQSTLTIEEALAEYQSAGYPDRRREKRSGKALNQEQSRCETLAQYFVSFPCAKLDSAALDDYADWRIKEAVKGYGGRAAELDLNTLKNALRWSVRKRLLDVDPFRLLPIPRYRKAKIKHCRESAPASGDELHLIARHLFEGGRASATLGWLTLLTAMIGCRISEMTSLRVDAKPEAPGHYADGVLWLRRKKGGANNFFQVVDGPNPYLQRALEAFFAWRSSVKRFKGSPWWFPGRDPALPLMEQSLTHALHRVGKLLCDETRTAHGLRSMYVTCRRSMGAPDPIIALELGQTSGGREIVRTYGDGTPKKRFWMPREPGGEEIGPPAPAWFYTT